MNKFYNAPIACNVIFTNITLMHIKETVKILLKFQLSKINGVPKWYYSEL